MLCSGDIIFMADQDDVWFPDKIEKTLEVMHDVAAHAKWPEFAH